MTTWLLSVCMFYVLSFEMIGLYTILVCMPQIGLVSVATNKLLCKVRFPIPVFKSFSRLTTVFTDRYHKYDVIQYNVSLIARHIQHSTVMLHKHRCAHIFTNWLQADNSRL